MIVKPADVTIVQITSDSKVVYGLGSDQRMYQWNFLDSTWHLYAVQKEREAAPDAKPAA